MLGGFGEYGSVVDDPRGPLSVFERLMGIVELDPRLSVSEVSAMRDKVDWIGSVVMDLQEFYDVLRNVIMSVKIALIQKM